MKKKFTAMLVTLCMLLSLMPGPALAGSTPTPTMNYSALVAYIDQCVAEGKTGSIRFLPAEDFGWPESAVLTIPVNLGLSTSRWEIPDGITVLFERNCRGLAAQELTINGNIQTSYSSQDSVLSNCNKVIIGPTGTFSLTDGGTYCSHNIREGKIWEVQKGGNLNARIQLGGTLTGEGTVSGAVETQGGFTGSDRNGIISGELTFTKTITLGDSGETYADTITIPEGSHIKLNKGGAVVIDAAEDTLNLNGTLECLEEESQYREASGIRFREAGKVVMTAGSQLILHNPSRLTQNVVGSGVDLTEETKDQFPCLIDGTGSLKVYGAAAERNIFTSSPDDVARFLESDILIPAELFINFPEITLWRSWMCEHIWDEGIVTKKPTCTEAGEKTVECTVCGTLDNQTVAAVGHAEEPTPAVEPTQTTVGYTAGTRCTVCGEQVTGGEMIPALFAGLEPVAEDGILTVKMNPEQDFILLAAFYDEEGQFCLAGGCEAKPGMEPATFGIPADSSGYRLFALDLGYRPECQAFYAEL